MNLQDCKALDRVTTLRIKVNEALEEARNVRELMKLRAFGITASREACDALKVAEDRLRELEADLRAM